jgi:Icc-related predicted phosphoesterase
MKILAFSDVCRWEGYEDLVDKYKPNIVILAGDLTSDGNAAYSEGVLELIPGYAKEKSGLFRRYRRVDMGGGVSSGPVMSDRLRNKFYDDQHELDDRYEGTKDFKELLEARKRMHVDKFYAFLHHAGKLSRVLVVKGNHDDAVDYDSRRINKIPGCQEISGKSYTWNRCVFLGFGFEQAGYRSPLRSLVADFKGKAEIVIAHAPQRNVRLIAEIRPKLMIRGHFGSGQYIVDGTPTVFTSGLNHAVIEIGRTGLPRIRRFGSISISDQTIGELKRDSWSDRSFRRTWPWLRRYPGQR